MAMESTLTSGRTAAELIDELEGLARGLEDASVRRGWGSAEGEVCVFPAQQLVDTLLDIRVLGDRGGEGLRMRLDAALREHALRPGASTTGEVIALCRELREHLA
jgi:hypothetical protein